MVSALGVRSRGTDAGGSTAAVRTFLEQRIRSANSLRVTGPADHAHQRLGLDLTTRV